MPTQVETAGGPVLVARGPGGFVATPVTCPHKDESLRFSVLMGDVLVCPHHGYEFSLVDGRCRNARRCAALTIVPLQEVDGELWIDNEALSGLTGAG
jgi:3-phenylpropionate/trans-cinnamate dioxygenase ferredoxin subunit